MSQIINGEGDLYALADGTVIAWERINGDSTSMAIAFVHSDADPDQPDADPVLWISPGGWQPVSPDQAGIRYPAIALGTLAELMGDQALATQVAGARAYINGAVDPDQTEWREAMDGYRTLVSGGTYLRETALESAARAWQGMTVMSGTRDEQVLKTAQAFLDWLADDTRPDAI